MKKKADKQQDVQNLHAVLESVPHVFVAGFDKITVRQDVELRKAVRDAGGSYRVIKNKLAERAGAGTPAAAVLKGLAGMTSIAYTASDPVALAKALTRYAKENPTFTFKAGVVEGTVFDVGAIESLATMPSRDEMMAKLLFLINAPAQRLATAIGGVGRQLAIVIDQGCKENRFSA